MDPIRGHGLKGTRKYGVAGVQTRELFIVAWFAHFNDSR